jgi:hypothetical protein
MANDEKLFKAIVAKGRTVTVGERNFGPGKEVSLPADEVKKLAAGGFLVDPNAPELPRGEGPVFSVKEGPSIKVAA